MKVLALVEDHRGACYRYRIEPFAWAMAQRGLELVTEPLRRGALGRIRQFRGARGAAAVILQRKLLPIWQLILLRRSARRLIYDVDDAQFQRDSYNPKGPDSRMRTARFWATVNAADAIICGNDYLGARVEDYVDPRRVHVIPTCIEPRRYQPAEHRRSGSAARLVWIGQASTLRSLDRARPQLAAAAERLPGLEIRLICDRVLDLSPLKVGLRRWSSAGEAANLAEGDIGVNWLPDDAWSRGKCGLRVLQFMAAGLPVVANPVGMNRRMVVHGRTGLLASTPAEWAAAIARLAADPALRRKLGTAGRRLVERHYDLNVWEEKFAATIGSIAGLHVDPASPGIPPSADEAASNRPAIRV